MHLEPAARSCQADCNSDCRVWKIGSIDADCFRGNQRAFGIVKWDDDRASQRSGVSKFEDKCVEYYERRSALKDMVF